MADLVPVLIGTAGFVVGECYVLDEGADIVVGRSRTCDISLRKAAAYLSAPPQVRDEDHDFNTVSRRHLRLQVQAGTLKVHDLSTNGSFVNDEPINQVLQPAPGHPRELPSDPAAQRRSPRRRPAQQADPGRRPRLSRFSAAARARR
jgi:pSer/pThr/pTyr-binding forkhead associated (FHA) protein